VAYLELIDYGRTHRLVSARYIGKSVLEALPLPEQVLSDLSELDAATNERKIAEGGSNPEIGPGELLYGVPEADVVNAAFSHPSPHGGRFNSSGRGAWYAGVEVETSIAEVSFHKRRFLQDARIRGDHTFDYIDFLADFSGNFHHIEISERDTCLKPEPVPQCYGASQAMARALLYEGSNGIVYPSVRHLSGTCIACFRPALVFHPRRDQEYRITLKAEVITGHTKPSRRTKA
jgi:RES domain-containing protein